MAIEYPRRYVWSGDDDHKGLTFLVEISDAERRFTSRYLTKAFSPGLAIVIILEKLGTKIEGAKSLHVAIRPLTEEEVKKNSLKLSEVVVLDDLSYINLTEH